MQDHTGPGPVGCSLKSARRSLNLSNANFMAGQLISRALLSTVPGIGPPTGVAAKEALLAGCLRECQSEWYAVQRGDARPRGPLVRFLPGIQCE